MKQLPDLQRVAGLGADRDRNDYRTGLVPFAVEYAVDKIGNVINSLFVSSSNSRVFPEAL